ncbi:MAG: helix-turn-helix transcriptional regulator [Verrucomicrobia bacterium]|nr:helix-turn-helix transcriptional regulator [Verrucomicrobiota bacterium]
MLRYRLNSTPTRSLPLNVRSAGYYRLAPGQKENRDPGGFLQVFWSVAGKGQYTAVQTAHVIKPGTVFYYADDEPHRLEAGPEGWDYRWLTFDGRCHKSITREYALGRAQTAGPCPSALFEELDIALRDPTADGELIVSALAYKILLLASAPQTSSPPDSHDADSAAAAKDWLDAHFTDARLNITGLTARLHLHRASLHRLFTRRYGVAPVQYLGRLRMRLALELLSETQLPVADVAVRCGLPDHSHFSKLISRHTGFSPRVYRQKHARTHGDSTSA